MPRLLTSDEFNLLCIGGLRIEPAMGKSVNVPDNMTQYYVSPDWNQFPDSNPEFIWPGKRVLKRLNEKFLNGRWYDEISRDDTQLVFRVRSDRTLEDRAAFFAALASHTKFKNKR